MSEQRTCCRRDRGDALIREVDEQWGQREDVAGVTERGDADDERGSHQVGEECNVLGERCGETEDDPDRGEGEEQREHRLGNSSRPGETPQ